MKAPKFRYVRPSSIDDVYRLLVRHGHEAQLLAGGQSLLAGLNMRLSTPALLVDITGLEQLDGITLADDEVVIGALTRHTTVLNSPIVRQHVPLIADAIRHVGHVAIRNRGTFGGSLAQADPAAELPACVVALGATMVLGGSDGTRRVPAEDFFTGLMQTDLRPGELILEARIPAQRRVHGFAELSRRHGDFAVAGIAALATLDGARIADARLVYFGCVDHAGVARHISAALTDRLLPLGSTAALLELLRHDLNPSDDPTMRSDTKLQLAAALTRRTLNALQEGSVR
jgi:aerobic carbon-monoxide dehydrogenase medium subunit